jgi:hypothetical protein
MYDTPRAASAAFLTGAPLECTGHHHWQMSFFVARREQAALQYCSSLSRSA